MYLWLLDMTERPDQPPPPNTSLYTEAEVVSDAIGRLLDASLLKRTPEAVRLAADVCGVSVREVRDSYRDIVDATMTVRPRSAPVRLPAATIEPVKINAPTIPTIIDYAPLAMSKQDSGLNLSQIQALLHLQSHPNSQLYKATGPQGVSNRSARVLERMGYVTITTYGSDIPVPLASLSTKGADLVQRLIKVAITAASGTHDPKQQPIQHPAVPADRDVVGL